MDIITPAQEADLPILCEIFNEARDDNGAFPKDVYDIDAFRKVIEGEAVLVARVADKIAGFASVWEADTFLHHLFVSPHYQRQGIGSALIDHCIKLFGLPMALKCVEANTEACRFYERRGWRNSATAEGPEGRYILYVRELST